MHAGAQIHHASDGLGCVEGSASRGERLALAERNQEMEPESNGQGADHVPVPAQLRVALPDRALALVHR